MPQKAALVRRSDVQAMDVPTPTWKWKRVGGTWVGTVTIPFPGRTVAISTTGRKRVDALLAAATAAKAIASNPLLSAVLPPGTPLAIEAITRIAKSPTAKTLRRFAGPGAKRLASALRKVF